MLACSCLRVLCHPNIPIGACSWATHSGRYSGGYAAGHSASYSLANAKQKCVDLGATCNAVTCDSGGCTVRASTTLRASSAETTYTQACEHRVLTGARSPHGTAAARRLRSGPRADFVAEWCTLTVCGPRAGTLPAGAVVLKHGVAVGVAVFEPGKLHRCPPYPLDVLRVHVCHRASPTAPSVPAQG